MGSGDPCRKFLTAEKSFKVKHFLGRAEVVAQLAEQSLPTSEVHGSSLVIGTIYIER